MKKMSIMLGMSIVIVLIGICVNVFFDQQRHLLFTSFSRIETMADDGEGNGGYRYPLNYGKAEFCTLYVYINVKTGARIESEDLKPSLTAELGWEKMVDSGLRDKCPKSGNGCNPYSCQKVPYN